MFSPVFLCHVIFRIFSGFLVHFQIMTYKNFALDHFLEACLEFIPKENIVRIGKADEKRSEKLSEVNLRNVSWIISLYTYWVELLLEKSSRIFFYTRLF